MRYAVTSDLHLKSEAPQRLENLAAMLVLLEKEGVEHLIIAGDLFDKGYAGYAALDELLSRHKKLQVIAFPGNHDQGLAAGQFSSPNMRVLETATLMDSESRDLSLVFLPYQDGKTMGEALEELPELEKLAGKPWVLFSHGDFGPRRKHLAGNEEGYFPLTPLDISRFRPTRVILGHIHKPSPLDATVVYPGSPFPLDINETGQRRVLLLEQQDGTLSSLPLSCAPLMLQTEVFVLPDGQEEEQVRSCLDGFWEQAQAAYVGKPDKSRTMLRVHLRGCATERGAVCSAVEAWVEKQKLILESVDDGALRYGEADRSLQAVAEAAEQALHALKLQEPEAMQHGQELQTRIREQVLHHIYGLKE